MHARSNRRARRDRRENFSPRALRALRLTFVRSLRQRLLAVLQALRDFDERIAVVLELDVGWNVPLVLLQQLQDILDRRVSLSPRRVAAAVGPLLLLLGGQVRDARRVLLKETKMAV